MSNLLITSFVSHTASLNYSVALLVFGATLAETSDEDVAIMIDNTCLLSVRFRCIEHFIFHWSFYFQLGLLLFQEFDIMDNRSFQQAFEAIQHVLTTRPDIPPPYLWQEMEELWGIYLQLQAAASEASS